MAATVDVANSPVRFTVTGPTGSTMDSAAFTAPANTLLVLCVEHDGDTTADSLGVLTVSASLSTGSALTWTQQVSRGIAETTDGGAAYIFTAPAATSEARVVRVTSSWTGTPIEPNKRRSAKVYVVTGADIAGTPVDTVGANNEGGNTTNNNLTTTAITPGANGLLFAADCDWTERGTFDASSDLTQNTATYAALISVCDGYKAVTSGVSATANLNAGGALAPQHKWCQIIVREAAAAVTAAQQSGIWDQLLSGCVIGRLDA